MRIRPKRKINLAGASVFLVFMCLLTLTGQIRGQLQIDLSDPVIRADYAAQLAQQSRFEKEQAWQIALEQGWSPLEEINGVTYELMAIRDGQLFVNTTHNVNAAISTATNLVRNAAPYNVNGAGETVGVWDAGGIRTTHQEFGTRVTIMDSALLHYHSTHVGGTIGASGIMPNALGMAPSVDIDSYNWTDDEAEMILRAMSTAGQAGKIQISNHSYGYNSGWADNYTPIRWYGTWGLSESENFGIYSSYSRAYDQICYSAPYFLPFKSAGNDRNDSAPSIGTTFAYYSGGWVTKSYAAGDPPNDYHDSGWDTIPHRGNSKNVITVGAVNDAVWSGARYLPFATMTAFSGWGPTDDGRIKPDIVANGFNLYSTDKDNDFDYRTLPGTSMSTPNASGSAILLVEYYKDLFGSNQYMRASTIKALILHTADDLWNAGPDYRFGWGLMNTEAAADVITEHYNNPGSNTIREDSLSTTDTSDTFSVYSDGSTPLRVTICWTDYPGASTTTLNSPTIRLVNDLDLRLTGPSGTYYPYVLNPASPGATATTGDNNRDNVEQVYIASPPAGNYTVTIDYDGAITNITQRYSMIVSGTSEPLPEISVTPTYFDRSLYAYQNLTEQFTISNTGGGILDYQITTSSVLWDLTHGVYSGYSPTSNYTDLVTTLQDNGYSVDTTTNISSADLDQYDILVICLGSAWTTAYTTSEVNAIKAFVSAGGGLLIMGDNPSTPNANINPVAQAFGTTCGVSSTDSIITNIDAHPIMDGVAELTLASGGELTATTSDPQAWDSNNKAVVTTQTHNSGRVVVVGDINAWVNGSLTDTDNQTFMENTFDWLNVKSGWLRTSSLSGTISGGNNRVVYMFLDTWGVEPGSYHAKVVIANNDTNENPTFVNVYLTVMPQPNIYVDTPSIQVELIPGTRWSHTVNIANNGDEDLEYVIADTDTTEHPTFIRVWQTPNPLGPSDTGYIKAELNDPD
ncbi:MAG: S8 family serine peptidase, partial [Planctomycetes bacterium]|nr:S8 family serine peptidase [Planctomycetota bacterium]